MRLTRKHINTLLLLIPLSITFGCNSIQTVSFKTPIDTKTKQIELQNKRIYEIKDLEVFASNNFDGARLNGFEKVNDSTVLIKINPENTPINNSAYYAFKTWSSTPKTIYYTFNYPKGYKHRYIPKLKKNEIWKIIDSVDFFKNDSIVTVKLQIGNKPIIVAAQEIQSSKDVKGWYSNLIKGKENYIHFQNYGKSVLGRNLPVLDIYKGEKKNKPIIVLLTRQHPPEVTGYFAFQEFLQTILSETQLSNIFLKKYRVLAFPIMNPDGVDLGHWRHNAGGVDTNRDWSEYNQPEIRQVVKYITNQVKKSNSKIILGLDFHSTKYDVFYTNKKREGTTLPTFIDDWFVALEENIDDFKVNEKPGNSNKPVSKGWLLYGQNATGITYEVGDATPRDRIKTIGKVAAEQMMKILLK